MTVSPDMFFALASVLFSVGIMGVVGRKNLLVVYLSLELMLNAVTLILATFSRMRLDEGGSAIALIIMGVIAAEAALFLAVIVQVFRKKRHLDSDRFAALAQGGTL